MFVTIIVSVLIGLLDGFWFRSVTAAFYGICCAIVATTSVAWSRATGVGLTERLSLWGLGMRWKELAEVVRMRREAVNYVLDDMGWFEMCVRQFLYSFVVALIPAMIISNAVGLIRWSIE